MKFALQRGEGEKREGVQISKQITQTLWTKKYLQTCIEPYVICVLPCTHISRMQERMSYFFNEYSISHMPSPLRCALRELTHATNESVKPGCIKWPRPTEQLPAALVIHHWRFNAIRLPCIALVTDAWLDGLVCLEGAALVKLCSLHIGLFDTIRMWVTYLHVLYDCQ